MPSWLQSPVNCLDDLVSAIDSCRLHGPTQRVGLTVDNWADRRAMEVNRDSDEPRSDGPSRIGPLRQVVVTALAVGLAEGVEQALIGNGGPDFA
jgi:hypothetical protein